MPLDDSTGRGPQGPRGLKFLFIRPMAVIMMSRSARTARIEIRQWANRCMLELQSRSARTARIEINAEASRLSRTSRRGPQGPRGLKSFVAGAVKGATGSRSARTARIEIPALKGTRLIGFVAVRKDRED